MEPLRKLSPASPDPRWLLAARGVPWLWPHRASLCLVLTRPPLGVSSPHRDICLGLRTHWLLQDDLISRSLTQLHLQKPFCPITPQSCVPWVKAPARLPGATVRPATGPSHHPLHESLSNPPTQALPTPRPCSIFLLDSTAHILHIFLIVYHCLPHQMTNS